MNQRFLKQYRLRRGADFERVFARRRAASDDVLLIFVCENGLEHPRLGLSVSRKVGSAVVRNRWKRALREAFRLQCPKLPVGLDLVVIPRAPQLPDSNRLQSALVRTAARAARKLAAGGNPAAPNG